MVHFSLPIVDEPINSLLSQHPSRLMVVVVLSPAEHHQAFSLGIPDVVKVLQQLFSVGTDPLKKEVQ